jgi:drug/metabolite transporter (DMT)-like permease
LDFLVHRPDLPLYDDTMKLGLGLWNYPAVALALEAALLFGGMILYLRVTKPINAIGRVGLAVLGVVMLAIQSYVFFGPPPTSPAAAAMTALVSYVVFAALAEWLARQRRHAVA